MQPPAGSPCSAAADPPPAADQRASARPDPAVRPDPGARPDPAAQPHPATRHPAQPARSRSPRWGIALIAASAFGLELAVSARYGYHRDELYFLAAGQHPAFGYVDQPPLTPMLARLSAALSGNSLVGLRVVPALAMAVLVVTTAVMSRMLGAGRPGQVLAALAAATCAEYLAAMHLLTTTTPDFVCWAITLLLAVRLLRSQDPRWWVAIGGCVGIGAQAKWNIGFLAGSLLVGFAASSQRHLLASRWLMLGAVIAAALAAPDIAWQAAHGWPALQVFRALQAAAWHNRATYWPVQILYTGVALTPVWVAGLIWSLRSQEARRYRPVAIACAAAIAVFFVLGGKPYYPGAVFTFLFAAGSVPLERWVSAHAGRRSRIRPAMAAMLVSCALALPIALPVLPAAALRTVPLQKINYDLAETIAWPRLARLVAREYDALPARHRRHTAILTGNYGEAGAIDRYRATLRLPVAYSGANNFWLWGPPPAADTSAIAVGLSPALLRRWFASVRQVATFGNGIGVRDDEEGAPVYLATGLRSSWHRAWGAFRDYS